MTRCVFVVPLVAALAAFGAWPRPALADDSDSAQRAAVEGYVAAIRSQDLAALRRLIHPATLACIDDENREYFDFVFANELQLRSDLAGDFRITRIDPVGDGSVSAEGLPGILSYPVKPSYEFQIDVDRSAYSSLTLMRPLALHEGRWHVVLTCPSEKGLAFFRENRKRGEEQRVRAEQLASELSDPVRSEIRALLEQGQRIPAVNRYRETTGVDLTTAMLVINLLGEKKP